MSPAVLLPLLAASLGSELGRRSPSFRSMGRAVVVLTALSALRWLATLPRASEAAGRRLAVLAGAAPPAWDGIARWSWAVEYAAGFAFCVIAAIEVRTTLQAPFVSGRQVLVYSLPITEGCAVPRGAGFILGAPLFWLAYPIIRGPGPGRALEAAMVVSACVQLAAAARWALASTWPSAGEGVALILAFSSAADAIVLLAVRGGSVYWYVQEYGNAFTWIAVIGVELWALFRIH